MSPAPHHNLSELKIAAIVVVNIGVRPSHRSTKAGPFRVKESYPFDPRLSGAHSYHAYAFDNIITVVAFIASDHTHAVASFCQPLSYK
jgi:hypothetical protein